MEDILLSVENLSVQFRNDRKWIRAVSDVSYSVKRGETVGLVGESGCGKSVSSMAVMGLLPGKDTCRVEGSIIFDGKSLLNADKETMRKLRGDRVSMVFQEPMTCFNPVVQIGKQIAEAIKLHRKMDRKAVDEKVVDLLDMVGIPDPAGVAKRYPFELSGGMRQRAMIAMAMCCDPELLIADEPTTALDVTIQAQILDLIRTMQQQTQTATIMITHDLGVIADICERVIVMYAGQIVEESEKFELFDHPAHPYTRALLQSIPSVSDKGRKLFSIPGTVPMPGSITKGCVFAPRCHKATARCTEDRPELKDIGSGHICRCWCVE